MHQVCDDISKITGYKIELKDDLYNPLVTIKLDNITIENGLKRIINNLRNFSFSIVYDNDKQSIIIYLLPFRINQSHNYFPVPQKHQSNINNESFNSYHKDNVPGLVQNSSDLIWNKDIYKELAIPDKRKEFNFNKSRIKTNYQAKPILFQMIMKEKGYSNSKNFQTVKPDEDEVAQKDTENVIYNEALK